jgi:hypothetical protein
MNMESKMHHGDNGSRFWLRRARQEFDRTGAIPAAIAQQLRVLGFVTQDLEQQWSANT